jgi:MoxR-like ATPase
MSALASALSILTDADSIAAVAKAGSEPAQDQADRVAKALVLVADAVEANPWQGCAAIRQAAAKLKAEYRPEYQPEPMTRREAAADGWAERQVDRFLEMVRG